MNIPTRPLLASALALAAAVPVHADVGDGTALDEVVVTARRREENLQQVPVAATVLAGELIDATATVNPQQASLLVPSLYYNSANPRNTAYTIRGLGSNTLSVSSANDGIEPGVGFYVDGVYHARPATAAFDFTDIQSIEVLRGPQGTLFGKNSADGAIHITSRSPSFTPESQGEVSVGGNGYLQTRATLSGPLSDTVAGRLSAQFTGRGGVIYNVRTGQSLNNLNNVATRGQLLFRPSEAFQLRLVADLSDLNAACCTQAFLRVGQSKRAAARQFPALAAGLGYQPPSTDVFDRVTDIDAPLAVRTRDGGVAAIADWTLAQATLTSVSAWRYWDWDVANDRDYTGLPIQLVQRIPSRQDQYSEELRIATRGEGRWTHVAGLYFFTQHIGGSPTSVYGPAAAYWLLNQASFSVPIPANLLDGYGQFGSSRYGMKSYAAFGESNFRITPRLTATLGLRYTYEDKQGSYATQVSGGLDLTTLPAATATVLNNAKLSIFRPQAYTAADAGGNISGRANLAWQATDALLAYASFARGYKSGGLNMSGLPVNAQNQPALATAVIRDETNQTLELGLKSSLLGGRATVDVALFRTTVRDYQANIVSSSETAALRSYPANIPEVRVQGGELDAAARVAAGLTLRASAAYAAGINANYPAGPCPLEVQTAATVACDLTGKPLAGLSRWVGSVGADWRSQGAAGHATAHVDVATRSGYNSDTSNSIYTWIPGYTVVNGSVGWVFNEHWRAEAFARNLLAKDYITALTIQTGNSGLILGQPSDPRQVGLRIRAQY